MGEGLGELEGQVLGDRYRLGHKIGQGGMGTVYAATQTSLGRQVAIKVLLPQLSSDESLVARFRAEAERSGQLNHPHIVQVFDFGKEVGGSAWIAMELLDGEPLTDRIARGPLSEADAVRFAKETLAGLEAAHSARLVHRDLKPDNIFITKAAGVGERVKLLDFGIAKLLDGDSAAKLTATGLVIGTPLYMSAEQARGDDLDERSDLYSLGAVMYEALTGEPPFTGRNYNALLVAVLTQEPRPITELRPDLTPELAAVVMGALNREPSARPASAIAMSAALDGFTPKTETPAPNAQMGMAATMATPGAGVVAGAVVGGAVASRAASGQIGATAVAPEAGAETGAGASGAVAGAVAGAPGTGGRDGAAVLEAAPKPRARRHGWLIPSMVAVGLLAGIAGTATLMQQGGGDGDAAMVASAEMTEPVVAVTPVMPVAPVAPMQPAAAGQRVEAAPGTGQPAAVTTLAVATGATDDGTTPGGPGEAAPAVPAAVPSDDATETRAERGTKRAARARRPRVGIQYSGGAYGRHREMRNRISNHANWSACWPPNRPFPEMNRGIDFSARTTADGALSDFAVLGTGSTSYPEIAACMLEKLQGASAGPSDNGEGGAVRIHFSFYELRR